jgi:hypothetical protein
VTVAKSALTKAGDTVTGSVDPSLCESSVGSARRKNYP